MSVDECLITNYLEESDRFLNEGNFLQFALKCWRKSRENSARRANVATEILTAPLRTQYEFSALLFQTLLSNL
jgi:hypothetical protein